MTSWVPEPTAGPSPSYPRISPPLVPLVEQCLQDARPLLCLWRAFIEKACRYRGLCAPNDAFPFEARKLAFGIVQTVREHGFQTGYRDIPIHDDDRFALPNRFKELAKLILSLSNGCLFHRATMAAFIQLSSSGLVGRDFALLGINSNVDVKQHHSMLPSIQRVWRNRRGRCQAGLLSLSPS